MMRRQNFVFVTLLATGAWLVVGCGDSGRGTDHECTPTDEVCDNVDNDCDNQTDEELTQACGSDSTAGTQTCEGGSWGTCQVTAPVVETCNNADDDGDGDTDEDLQQGCSTACGAGVETCNSGNWLGCTAPEPETEVCDGRDNDCDGGIDEELERACDTDCGGGVETCSLGSWVDCTAPQVRAETCDDQDNDCDGATDEGLVRDCSNACGSGAETCAAGQWESCTARQPDPAELCSNDIDDDCDGRTDTVEEGCTGSCGVVGSTTICSANVGICTQGVTECLASGEWSPCMRDGAPVIVPDAVVEACDNEDNDCDGGTDESFEGMGDACGTDEGACVVGRLACVDGEQVCQGERTADTEICDGADNDCDGATDEDLRPDTYETNETCATAENLHTIWASHESRVVAGALYPEGGMGDDLDFYQIRVEETDDLCVPITGQDDDYNVYVALSHIPDGVDFDLCVTYDRKEQDPCDGDTLGDAGEICTTEAGAGGTKLLVVFVHTECALNDDIDVAIEVRLHDGSGYSCLPYRLTIWAENIEE